MFVVEFWEHSKTLITTINEVEDSVIETVESPQSLTFDCNVSPTPNEEKTFFPNYSISPENSSFMKSIFEEKSQPPFDLSTRMKTPPTIPPPLHPQDIEEMKKSVRYKVMMEEEKKDR